MANRLDAVTPVEYESGGEKKTRWVRIGVAFSRDKGGYDVRLDAVPVNGRIMLMEPRNENRGGGGGGGGGQRSGGGGGGGPDDDIPFNRLGDHW
jgi:hypothetical protein